MTPRYESSCESVHPWGWTVIDTHSDFRTRAVLLYMREAAARLICAQLNKEWEAFLRGDK